MLRLHNNIQGNAAFLSFAGLPSNMEKQSFVVTCNTVSLGISRHLNQDTFSNKQSTAAGGGRKGRGCMAPG